MRTLIASLKSSRGNLNGKLNNLRDMASRIQTNFEWDTVLDFCIKCYDKHKRYPAPDLINKYLSTDISEAEAISDPEIHLDRVLEEFRQLFLKKEVMDLAGETSSDQFGAKIRKLIALSAKGSEARSGDIRGLDVTSVYSQITSKPVGLQTFIPELDNAVSGCHYGSLTAIGGFTSHFKSTFALNMLHGNSTKNGMNQVLFSLEMPKEEILINLISRHSATMPEVEPIPAKSIKKGLLTEKQKEALPIIQASLAASEGRIIIYDMGDIIEAGGELFSAMDSLCIKADDELDGALDSVYFDHVQLGKYFLSGTSDLQAGNLIVSKVRDLSLDFRGRQLIGIVVSQFGRDAFNRASKKEGRYHNTAFAEANEIERSAYYGIALYTSEALKASFCLKFQLLKNRGGETIEEPRTTFCDPRYGVIGEAEISEVFNEGTLDVLAGSDAGSILG